MAYTPPPDGYTPQDPTRVDITGADQQPHNVPFIPYTHPFNELVPNPYTPGTGGGGSISEPTPNQYTISSTILGQTIPMCYGPRRVVGQFAAWYFDGDHTLILGVIFCYGEQNSITELKINNEAVSGLTWVTDSATHVGDGSTAIDALLTGISTDEGVTWTPTDTATWKKYAHAVVSIDTDDASAPGNFKIEAICGGRKIAPVGGGAKAMSTAPPRVAYDIETDAEWKGLDAAKIHDTSWGVVNTWCIETMDDGNPRYEYSGIITERNPDTAREMVLKHCLASTYIDTDGKRRMWCEMLPGALSGSWTSGGTPTPTEDDFESYAASSLPAEWGAVASNVAWTVEDDGSTTNNVLVGNPSQAAWGSCKWDDLGGLTNVDVIARVKVGAVGYSRHGIFARGSSWSSGKPASAVTLHLRRLGTNSFVINLGYTSGTYDHILTQATATGVSDGDWVYLRLYINGSTLKAGWSELGAPATFNLEPGKGFTQITGVGHVGAYGYAASGDDNLLFDDFYCGLDGSTAASTNDYLIALNGDGAATTELTVGDTIVYKGQLTTVVDITDDDNIQIADEIAGYESYIRSVDFLHLGVTDWVMNPSCSEQDINTVPDIIRASFTDGTNFGAQSVEVSYGAGTDKILEMSLPGCLGPETAGRVALTNLLIQHLQPYSWRGVVSPEIGAQLEPGDVVTFDTDLLTAQMGRVLPPVDCNTDGTYSVTLREYDVGAYSDDPAAVDTPPALEEGWSSASPPLVLGEYLLKAGAEEASNYMYGNLHILHDSLPAVKLSQNDDEAIATVLEDVGGYGRVIKYAEDGADSLLYFDAEPHASDLGVTNSYQYFGRATNAAAMLFTFFKGDGTLSPSFILEGHSGWALIDLDELGGGLQIGDTPVHKLFQADGAAQFDIGGLGGKFEIGDSDSTDWLHIDGGNIYFQKNRGIHSRDAAGTGYFSLLFANGADICVLGNAAFEMYMEGSETRPQYNGGDLALLTDVGGGYLPLAAGSGSPLTGSLYIDGAADPAVYLREAASTTNFSEIRDRSDTNMWIRKTVAAATAYIMLDPYPSDGTSEAHIWTHRLTNTTGTRAFTIFKGDGTATEQHTFNAGTGAVALAKLGGNLTVGGAAVTSHIYLDGAANPSIYIREGGSATGYLLLSNVDTNRSVIRNYNTAGTSYLDIDLVGANSSVGFARFFRIAAATPGVHTVQILEAGTTTVAHSFKDTGNVDLCQQGGNTTIKEGNLYLDKTNDPSIFLRESASATNYAALIENGDTFFYEKSAATNSYVQFNPKSTAGTGACAMRYFRWTNTTGAVFVELYQGDNSATVAHTIRCDTGNITLCQQGGEVTINGDQVMHGTPPLFHAYDAAGGITLDTSWADITWDTEVVKGTNFTHAADAAAIEINTDGWYEIHFEGTADNADASVRHEANWKAQLNTGAGYADVAGSFAASYHRVTGRGKDTASIHLVLDLNDGDLIKFRGYGTDATDITTVANGCRVTIKRLT